MLICKIEPAKNAGSGGRGGGLALLKMVRNGKRGLNCQKQSKK